MMFVMICWKVGLCNRYFLITKKQMFEVLKPFKKFAKKAYTSIYSKKLPPPTSSEQKIIEEFKEQMKEFGNELEKIDSHEGWKNRAKDILELTLEGDVRKFLQWKPILDTMNVSISGYLQEELKFLKGLRDWDTRWKKSIEEIPIGSPASYYLYPKSSGNLIHTAYHVARFEQELLTSVTDLDFVVEFGGGYGSMARFFYNLGFKGKYIIYDLPHVSILQTFYLKCVGLNVERNTENFHQILCLSDIQQFNEIVSRNLPSNSLFLSAWAFSEVPLSLRQKVEDLFVNFSHFLFAYQDKAFGIDNVKSFNELSKQIEKKYSNLNRKIKFTATEISHMPGNYYLFGKKLS